MVQGMTNIHRASVYVNNFNAPPVSEIVAGKLASLILDGVNQALPVTSGTGSGQAVSVSAVHSAKALKTLEIVA
jgi:hypothetical protein